MNDDDIGIGLPEQEDVLVQRPDGSMRYGIFRYQAQLARLESRIHSELYSARAQKRPALDRLRTVGELDKALLEWRNALPEEIQPENNIKHSQDKILPIIMMHFAYFNCLTTIHRVSIHHGSWTGSHLTQSGDTLHHENLNPRVYSSQSICIGAARHSIQLLHNIDLKGHSSTNNVVWSANPHVYFYALTPTPYFISTFSHFIYFETIHAILTHIQDAAVLSSFRSSNSIRQYPPKSPTSAGRV